MRRAGRPGKTKAAALLVVVALAGGLLTGIATIPILAVTGIVTRDAARTFNQLSVAGLGILPARSELLDAHGKLLAYYYPRNIYRVPVRFDQIAPVMQNAIIAIEDERFYHHGALDLRGTIRAVSMTLSGSGTQGGSDIAQQYVKNACILAAQNPKEAAECSAVTVARKVTELRVAANVMRRMTRHQLLAAYLNAAYFNHQAYGVEVAAQFYFSTPARSLTLTEAAMLAGLVQNPAAYDPLQHPVAATQRRNEVLQAMARLHYISRTVAESAQAQPLGLHTSPLPLQTGCSSNAARKAAFFCDYVISVLRTDPFYAKVWSALNQDGGMRVYTTLSPADQRAANHAVNFVQPPNSNYYNPGHNADTEVLLQPGTGDIRAIAINRPFGNGPGHTTVDYAVNSKYGASAGVQTGSSSKIFTLVTALREGLPFGWHRKVKSPTTVGPYYNCHGGYVQPYNVINAEGPQSAHWYTIYNGTTASINAFYATLEQQVGLCQVVRTAASLGLTRADGTSLLRRDRHLRHDNLSADNYPSFTLGSVYVSPLNMAAAYATVAARGVYCRPMAIRAISGRGGESIPVERPRCHRVIPATVADAANYVLQGVLGGGGTAAGRGIGIPAAAKTGTANDGFYAAFAGYTPRLAGYVSVFNPYSPTGYGRMKYPRANYREVDGSLSAPSQMFGDNAPGATWQLTFMRLHLRPKQFVYPPASPYFDLPLTFKPPKKKHKSPSPSPSPSASASATASPSPSAAAVQPDEGGPARSYEPIRRPRAPAPRIVPLAVIESGDREF
ncbi:MAG TPA: transglycosylase domain-containing protein [Streptosporangiaceae bacterium]|nr:transglycosylase domain-containing protein [Streptosporangiaceae bacterium]